MSNGETVKDSCSIGRNGCFAMQELQKEFGEQKTIVSGEGGHASRISALFKWKDDITKTMAKHAFILGLVVIIIEVAFKFIK